MDKRVERNTWRTVMSVPSMFSIGYALYAAWWGELMTSYASLFAAVVYEILLLAKPWNWSWMTTKKKGMKQHPQPQVRWQQLPTRAQPVQRKAPTARPAVVVKQQQQKADSGGFYTGIGRFIKSQRRKAVDSVGNFFTSLSDSIKKFLSWTGEKTMNTVSHLQPHAAQAVQATTRAAGTATRRTGNALAETGRNTSHAMWDWAKEYPWLAMCFLALATSMVNFFIAYSDVSWESFHQGLVMLATSAGFAITHYKKWGRVWSIIGDHQVETWIASSVISLAVSFGHEWWKGVAISLVSVIAGAITHYGGWPATGRLTARGFEHTVTFVGSFFKGLHGGFGEALLTLSFLCGLVTGGLYGYLCASGPNVGLQAIMAMTYTGFLLFLFSGLAVLIGTSIHAAKKGKV